MDSIYLTNSLINNKDKFIPLKKGEVSIYSCGPTVYDYAHIGNFRSFLMSDLLFRVFKYAGYKVKKVQNITDVGHLTNDDIADANGEDKIAKKAKAENKDAFEIARYYEKLFIEDEEVLRIIPPNGGRPRATEFITEQLELIKQLIAKEFAYEINGSVYFRTAKFKEYGELSGNKLKDLIAGARVEINSEKEDPLDFALWKKADKNHLMQWDFLTGQIITKEYLECVLKLEQDFKKNNDNFSSFLKLKILSKNKKFKECLTDFNESYKIIRQMNLLNNDTEIFEILAKFRGFPGWHIECSAMSKKLLGKNFDIHTGGEDNIFPHHECEIAQNQCSFGGNINYWLHAKHLLVDGKKMSKSKGNFYTIRDLLKEGWKGNEIRLALIKSHYRSSLNFSKKLLEESRKNIKDIDEAKRVFKHSSCHSGKNKNLKNEKISKFIDKYKTALFDDLNIPSALAIIFDMIRLGRKKTETQSDIYKFLENDFDQIFDIFSTKPKKQELSNEKIKEIEQKISQRNQARVDKNWELADQIRDDLTTEGIELIDERGETRWKIKD